MLADNNDPPPTIGETYAGAISSGVTRVQPHKGGRPDVIAAAGMSPYRMGTALMRLMSEWQSGATPATHRTPDPKELARRAALERANAGVQAAEEEFGPMKVSEKRARRAAAPILKHEMEFAEAEQRRLHALATDWQVAENKLRFQRMKTLPRVRSALLVFVREKEWENAEQLVADTIRHFLSPACPACQGRKRKVVPGTARAVGHECRKCRGTGEAVLQHGGRGRALLSHMKACVGQASQDMREGAHRLHRGDTNTRERADQRKHETIEKLRRADAEAQADAKADGAAIAEHFRKSMDRRRT